MRHASHAALLAFLLTAATGCAFTDVTIPLPAAVATPGNPAGGESRVVVLPPVTDQRAQQHRIGMKKNNLGSDTADVGCTADPAEWLRDRFEVDLEAAGFRVLDAADGNPATTVRIELKQLFVEPVAQWTTLDTETDLSVRIDVSRPDGLRAHRTYFVKGVGQGMMASQNQMVASVNESITSLMQRFIPDFINLLNLHQLGGAIAWPPSGSE